MEEISLLEWITIGVAGYAAFVGTIALVLEVRRWFKSGPRLILHLMQDAKTFNISKTEGKIYLVANVENRGNGATTITNLGLCDYGNLSKRFFSKPIWQAVVKNPTFLNTGYTIPHTLAPGKIWSGMCLYTDEMRERIENGCVYIMVFASHKDKPIMKRVKKSAVSRDDSEGVSN